MTAGWMAGWMGWDGMGWDGWMQDDGLDLGVLDRGWMLELQVVEHSPLDPTIHACLCRL